MIKQLPVLLLCGISLAACSVVKKGGSHKDFVAGTWQATAISVDGDNRDWPSPYPNYDSKSRIAYTSSNDRKFIYITMETGDELTQIKILKAGMTVSVDTGTNRKQEFAIKYPMENTGLDTDIPAAGASTKAEAMGLTRKMNQIIGKGIDQANQFSLDGFSGCDGGFMIAQANPCGIKLKARIDEYKELVWEAAIPVKIIFGKDSLTVAEAGKAMNICFHINGMKSPKKQGVDNTSNAGQNMGVPGGQRNSVAPGAMGGRTTTQSPLDHLYNATNTWKITATAIQ